MEEQGGLGMKTVLMILVGGILGALAVLLAFIIALVKVWDET